MEYRKRTSALQIVAFFILPILFLHAGIVPVEYRFVVLLLVSLAITITIWKEGWSIHQLGIRTDNLKRSLLLNAVFTGVVLIGILLLAKMRGVGIAQGWQSNAHFYGMFVIVSILQEFAFRAFLMPKLLSLTHSKSAVIVANAFLYGFVHTIFPHPVSLFLYTSFLGIGFAGIYYVSPNLIAISLSHIVINFIGVMFCFASFAPGC